MQINKKLVYLLAGLFVVASCWFWLAGRNDVHDIGERADTVGEQLESAQQEQRDQAAALDRATDAADRSQSEVRDSQRTAGRIEEIERSDAEIIGDCKSILSDIRKRGRAQGSSKD